MTLENLLVGVPAMLLCLVLRMGVVFWCVRYCAGHFVRPPGRGGFLVTIRPLVVAMLALMVANLAQIAV